MTSRSHRRASWFACLLTLAASLAHPLIAYGGSLCVAESHVAVELSSCAAPLAGVEPGCHPAGLDGHEPCTDVALGSAGAAVREASPRLDVAPSLSFTPLPSASLAPAPPCPSWTESTGEPVAVPGAATHLDRRVLTI